MDLEDTLKLTKVREDHMVLGRVWKLNYPDKLLFNHLIAIH